jgi:hypothetical protein
MHAAGSSPFAYARPAVRVVAPGQSIQTAIDSATAGDTIQLQPGVYTESLRLKPGVNLFGPQNSRAILQPSPFRRVITFDATEQSYTTRLANVTIRCGFATNDPSVGAQSGCESLHPADQWSLAPQLPTENDQKCRQGCGGGVFIPARQRVIFSNVIFEQNKGYLDDSDDFAVGGAIFADNDAMVTLSDSSATSNFSDVAGGLFVAGELRMTKATISYNRSFVGVGAVWAGLLRATDIVVSHNSTGGVLAGIHVAKNAQINGALISKNTSAVCAAVSLLLTEPEGVSSIANVVFSENQSREMQHNCSEIIVQSFSQTAPAATLFVDHVTSKSAGAPVFLLTQAVPSGIINLRNSALSGYPTAVRRWGGQDTLLLSHVALEDVISITESSSETLFLAQLGPIFSGTLGLADDGVHLSRSSALIDAGADFGHMRDIDGQYRPQRSRPDIGADEVYDAIPLTNVVLNCPQTSDGVLVAPVKIDPAAASPPFEIQVVDGSTRIYSNTVSSPTTTLAIPWQLTGTKTLTLLVSNGIGQATASCGTIATRRAQQMYLPLAANTSDSR